MRAVTSTLLVLLGLSGCSASTAEHQAGPPDIIVIFSDDHRFDMLGVAGNDRIQTPVLDRMATDGLYFDNAIAHVAQCGPARAMMISGLTPDQSGYLSIDIQRPGMDAPGAFAEMDTLPSLLGNAGYRTAHVGKWHVKNDPWLCGFEHIGLWFDGGFTDFINPELSNGPSRDTSEYQGHITQLFVDDAIRVLDERDEDGRPLYLWLCFTAPHEPFGPSPQHIEDLYSEYTDDDLMPAGIPRPSSERFRGTWEDYYGSITMMDEQIGRVLNAVERSDRSENTVVIYVSDNGFMMGRRGIDSKVCTYEDSIRVPMMVRAPFMDGPIGADDSQVSSLDVPPTVLGFAGVDIPSDWAGRDLTPVIAGGTAGPESTVAMWPEGESYLWGKYSSRVYRTNQYKLIVFEDEEHGDELYRIDLDPNEEHNLAGSSEHASAHDRIKGLLHDWLESTGDTALGWEGKWQPGGSASGL